MASQQDPFQHALSCNESWAHSLSSNNAEYFPKLAQGQSPGLLWIGCSDSRCPETTILGLNPGDVFVTRNIANIVHSSDLSLQSVIEYAVVHLKVQHVVLCGHTACGGAKGALGSQHLGLLEAWIHPLRALREDNLKELEGIQDEGQRLTRLVELNVIRGVKLLKQNVNVVKAMKERGMKVHGVVFEIEKGTCRVLKELEGDEEGEGGQERRRMWESMV